MCNLEYNNKKVNSFDLIELDRNQLKLILKPMFNDNYSINNIINDHLYNIPSLLEKNNDNYVYKKEKKELDNFIVKHISGISKKNMVHYVYYHYPNKNIFMTLHLHLINKLSVFPNQYGTIRNIVTYGYNDKLAPEFTDVHAFNYYYFTESWAKSHVVSLWKYR